MVRPVLALFILLALPGPTIAQRRVPVTVVTDTVFEEYPQWRGVIKSVFHQATKDFPQLVEWQLTIDKWRSFEPGHHATFSPALMEMAEQLRFNHGILIYFAGRQYEGENRRGFALLDQHALAVSLDSKRAMARVLRHELGHTMGLPHCPAKNIMADLSTQRTWEFSPLAKQALQAVRGMALGNAPLFFGADLPALEAVHGAWMEAGLGDERVFSRLQARLENTATEP